MGKKKPVQRREEDFNDKPDYAADLFHTKSAVKKPEKPVPPDPDLTLGARVSSGTLEKLSALKARIQEVPGKQGERKPEQLQKGAKSVQRPSSPMKRADDEGQELSFAELFNPQDEEDESFEELLTSSKLDWKSFKGQ